MEPTAPSSDAEGAAPAAGGPAPIPRGVHTKWEPIVRSVTATAGQPVLTLGSGVSMQDLLDVMLQSRALGIEGFFLSYDNGEGFDVSPTALAIPRAGEMVFVLEGDQWTGFLMSEDGKVLDHATGVLATLAADILPATYAWGGPPCDVTIASAADVPVERILGAMSVLSASKERCGRLVRFGVVPYSLPFDPARIPRHAPQAGPRRLDIRVGGASPPPPTPLADVGSNPAAPAPSADRAAEAAPVLREARRVHVRGVAESWRIVWRGKPEPICSPGESWNCPCAPYSYGEHGIAELVRSRAGHRDEVLDLGQAFVVGGDELVSPGQSILRHWPVKDGDYQASDRDALVREVHRRTAVRLMDLRDYNHDGLSAEFLLPVVTGGCAEQLSAVVGATKKDDRLHVFSSVANPTRPLLLEPRAWEALLDTRPSVPVTVVGVECGFRGAGTQVEVELTTVEGEISATSLEYACPKNGPPLTRESF